MSRKTNWGQETKKRLALESAKLIAIEGISNYQQAKKKAAERLGLPQTHDLPSNAEVEKELRAYQNLFQQNTQASALHALRLIALEAMLFFQQFKPRIFGPVLDGIASEHSSIQLHAFAETAEEFNIFLLEQHIPFETFEQRYTFGHQEPEIFPGFRFVVKETPIELIIFPWIRLKQSPSIISNRSRDTIRRASMKELQELIAIVPKDSK